MITAFNLRHNKYVSIPDWFKDTNSNVDQPAEDKINTIVSVSGGSSVVTAGSLLFTLYNKYVLKPATETQSILTIENKALIAVVKEGETTNLGDEVDAQGWNTSDYFDIAAETLITVTGQTSDQYGIVFYNNAKQVINAVPITSSPIEIMTPVDAFYCRISSMPVETFSINYYSPNSYTDSQLNLSNQNVTDYLALNTAIPEGYNKVSFEGNAFNLLVQKPLTLTKDNNNVIKLSLSQSSALSDGVWELRTDESSNQQYIYTTYPVVTQYGITTYADVDNLDIDSIYDGLPIDNQTIYWVDVTDEDGNVIKVLKSAGSGSGEVPDLSGYAKKEDLLDYLPLTGGTLTGNLMIKCMDIDNKLSLNLYNTNFRMTSPYGGSDRFKIVYDETNEKLCMQSASFDGKTKMGYMELSGIDGANLQQLMLTASETKVSGNIRLQSGTESIGGSIYFGSGSSCRIYEDTNNHMTISATNGIYMATNNNYYLDYRGGGVKINGGYIRYNEDDDYFELDGNLLVTGGITAFADSGSGNQWIISTDNLANITSKETTKVYSANVTTTVAKKVIEIDNAISTINNKLNEIKSGLKNINSKSSASDIGTALNIIYDKLTEYDT